MKCPQPFYIVDSASTYMNSSIPKDLIFFVMNIYNSVIMFQIFLKYCSDNYLSHKTVSIKFTNDIKLFQLVFKIYQ